MRKDQVTKQRKFRFEGIDYTVELQQNARLVFFATGGATKKGRITIDSWYFGQETQEFDDVGLIRNPFELSQIVQKFVVELIYEFPAASQVSYSASTDRKKRAFQRFSRQLAERLSVWYDYEPTDNGGHMYIRRKYKRVKDSDALQDQSIAA